MKKMKKTKKFGGTISNWQTHTLIGENNQELIMQAKERYPEIRTDSIMCFTGTVVDDPTGRWEQGFHMRSSTICHLDRENGIIETFNTIYKVKNEGDDIFEDLGQGIKQIYY